MADARDISNHAEPADTAIGAAILQCAPSESQCAISQQQIDISQSFVSSSGAEGSFECNICLELAQYPVVTLCGHLFCWPCLYEWLHWHSASQVCPVCKALVTQETVVPVYGRDNPGCFDPRKKSFTDLSGPQRPAGVMPELALTPEYQSPAVARPSSHAAAGRPDSFNLSAGFRFFPSLFGLQASDAIGYDSGYPFGWPIGWHNAHLHTHPHAAHLIANQQEEAVFSQLFLVLVLLVALCILFI